MRALEVIKSEALQLLLDNNHSSLTCVSLSKICSDMVLLMFPYLKLDLTRNQNVGFQLTQQTVIAIKLLYLFKVN